MRAILLGVIGLLALARSAAAQAPAPADHDAPAATDGAAPEQASAAPVASAPQRTLPLQLALRERRLERELEVLGERGSGRVTSAIVQLSVGAAFATVGAVLKNEIGRSLLILVGAGTMAHGGFLLWLHEDATALAKTYRGLPMVTPGLAAERVQFGERALGAIARGARRGRIADGMVSMAIAGAYVPLLWSLQRREDPAYRFGDSAFDYVALALSGINFASGLVTAIVRSDAEQRLEDYQALRTRVTAPGAGPTARRSPTLRFVPARAGAVFAGGLRF